MNRLRLGVNIDHVATIRNARGAPYPDPLRAARLAQGNTANATPLIAAALIYLVCLWPLVRLTSRFERRLLAAKA